jgi:3-dehydroquinate synthase
MKTKTGVILAAGIGQRLDIFETNKPLVKLRGISLIRWAIDRLRSSGLDDIYLVVRKEDRLIRKELIDFNGELQFINHNYPNRGMLGAILSIEHAGLTSPFFVTPCDLIFDQNPLPLFENCTDPEAISVLISTNRDYNAICGAQEKVNYVNGRLNYPDSDENTNALEVGIYHFTAASYGAFCQIARDSQAHKTVSRIFRESQRAQPVVMADTEWYDINTPVSLIRADLFLQKIKLPAARIEAVEATFEPLAAAASFDFKKPIQFDVHVVQGLVNSISRYEIIPHEFFYSPHHILIDGNIDALYGQQIFEQFKSLGYQIHKHLIDPGEKSKSLQYYAAAAEKILAIGIEKKSIIISVGGGVIKDLAGFLASTLYRGIGFISFPTTVLSQCDAAIALKQGINGTRGKNLLGTYYAPMKVIVDPSVLATLDERYIYDGLAECLKQAFAQDAQFYRYFAEYNGDIKDIDFLEEAIRKAIELKVSSIESDFYEESISLVNQYGHEIGHAVEHLSGYQLLHGESVAIGMRVSAELSRIMGIAGKEVVDAHLDLLEKFCLPRRVPTDMRPNDIINTLRYNKKFHGGKARIVLVKDIGLLWHDGAYYTVHCSDDLLKEAIQKSYD